MKLSEFHRAVTAEFGEAYGRVLFVDLTLPALGGRTAAAAISDGWAPKSVWMALCDSMDVPDSRRHGVGRPEPRA